MNDRGSFRQGDINLHWRSLGDEALGSPTDEILDGGGEWWFEEIKKVKD